LIANSEVSVLWIDGGFGLFTSLLISSDDIWNLCLMIQNSGNLDRSGLLRIASFRMGVQDHVEARFLFCCCKNVLRLEQACLLLSAWATYVFPLVQKWFSFPT
jgi:hypothetical protein